MSSSDDVGISNLGLHRCTEADRLLFNPSVDLNSQGAENIWSQLYCLDDPTSVKLQGNSDLDKMQILNFSLIGCVERGDSERNCISDEAAVSDYLADKVLVHYYNTDVYQPKNFENAKGPIQRKAV